VTMTFALRQHIRAEISRHANKRVAEHYYGWRALDKRMERVVMESDRKDSCENTGDCHVAVRDGQHSRCCHVGS
jgi:hypothetical protein